MNTYIDSIKIVLMERKMAIAHRLGFKKKKKNPPVIYSLGAIVALDAFKCSNQRFRRGSVVRMIVKL